MASSTTSFQDSANSDNMILMLESLRELYGKVFVILDNARAPQVQKGPRIPGAHKW